MLILLVSFVHSWDSQIYDKPEGEPDLLLDNTNISENYNCNVNENDISATGPDSYVLYTNIPKEINSIQFDFLYNNNNMAEAYIQWKLKDYYTSLSPSNSLNQNSTNYYLYNNEVNQAKELKIFLNDESFKISKISLYEQPLQLIPYTSNVPIWYYACAVIFAFILTTIIYLVNKKTKFWLKIKKWFTLNKSKILKICITTLIILSFAALIELMLSLWVFGQNSLGIYFNPSRYIFISGILTAILLIILILKSKIFKEELIFVMLALSIGTVMIIGAPLGHTCWDYDSHFGWVKGMSNINPQASEAEQQIISFKSEKFDNNNSTLELNNNYVNDINNLDNIKTGMSKRSIQPSHIPGAIIYSVSKFFKIPISTRIYLVRFLYLFLYTIICYFAIKKLKTHKWLLITIALFPTSLFLASSIAYDWWVTSFIMLGIAYFISELQQPDKIISKKETIIMCGSLLIGCLPKLIYMPVLLIPLFLRKHYFKQNKKLKKEYNLTCICFILFLIFALFIAAILQINSSGDARGGQDVNSSKQFAWILSNPIQYLSTLTTFLIDYLSPLNSYGYISSFAYLGSENKLSLILFALMIMTAIIGNNKYSKYSSKIYLKILSIIFFIGTISMIASALYISYTPVGLPTINGCQLRYITPLLFPFLSLIFNFNFKANLKNSLITLSLSVIFILILFFNTYQLIIKTMI